METKRDTCFVIMPFSKTTEEHGEDYWTEHFETFLKPLIEETPNLEVRRSEALRGDILRQIITDLVTSHVVVADLTDNNNNVYWELGVRQSFKHGTITIAEEGTKLPFDIGVKGTLFYYPKNHLKMKGFIKQFKEAIQDCCSHPDRPDSHVLETISGRGTLFEILQRDEAIRRLDAVLSECSYNLRTLENVINIAQKNPKKTESCQIPTVHFRTMAIELLITNRYLDEKQEFFEAAEYFSEWIEAINDQMKIGGNSEKRSMEEWLLEQEETVAKLIGDFKAEIEATRNKLSKLI